MNNKPGQDIPAKSIPSFVVYIKFVLSPLPRRLCSGIAGSEVRVGTGGLRDGSPPAGSRGGVPRWGLRAMPPEARYI